MTKRKSVKLNPTHLEPFAIGVPSWMRAEIDKRAAQAGVNPSELGRFVWAQALRKWRVGIKSHGRKWLIEQIEREKEGVGRLVQVGHLVGSALSGEGSRSEEAADCIGIASEWDSD